MNNIGKFTSGAILVLAVAATGYWFGKIASSSTNVVTSTSKVSQKVLYYRNPMGLPDTSLVPKKDSMGMDYVPVFEIDAGSTNQISISLDKVQKLGVKSESASLRELKKSLHVIGRIEIDERRTYTIAPKFEGWIERLYVNTSGQTVTKGQPLFDVYSPDLVSAQRENALAEQGLESLKDADDEAKRSMQQLVTASARRLKNWDITGAQSGISDSSDIRPSITFLAPATGIVLEKKAVQGMRFMPGEMLYQIVDLSSVWVIAEVPEQDIGMVQLGTHAQVIADAYPERIFDGKVVFIYPTLNNVTRTVQVRMEIANSTGQLKPAMFASTQIDVGKTNKVLTVPTSAVIDSGTRQVVLVRLNEGRFESRVVKLGSHSDNYIEVLAGITEGEQVVTSANFLIDAESNLKAALGAMGEQTTHVKVSPNTSMEDPAAHASPTSSIHKTKTLSHLAHGILESINSDGTVSITHEPIKSLGWPGMTMDFMLTNSALVTGLQPGTAITFELVERKPDEWLIIKIKEQPQEH